jgi:hypothetical protein
MFLFRPGTMQAVEGRGNAANRVSHPLRCLRGTSWVFYPDDRMRAPNGSSMSIESRRWCLFLQFSFSAPAGASVRAMAAKKNFMKLPSGAGKAGGKKSFSSAPARCLIQLTMQA